MCFISFLQGLLLVSAVVSHSTLRALSYHDKSLAGVGGRGVLASTNILEEYQRYITGLMQRAFMRA